MKQAFILFVLLSISLYGQQKNIQGTVYDDKKVPLPGATIQIIGDQVLGAITNFDGEFSLRVKSLPATIVISYLGYDSQEIKLNNETLDLKVYLKPQVAGLEEVVVVGYGTQRKSDLTGAISSVRVKENVARQSNTIDQLLQGRVAGVQVIQNGTPGSGISVRIRGANSLRGNNEPLYVVDGIIVSSAGEDALIADSSGNAVQESQSGLNGINPRDIDKIEVLKDASAAAIYGSRGANGVVLITTKKGKVGKASINTYMNTSLSEVNKKFEMLNSIDYARYQNERNLVSGNEPIYQIDGAQVYRINENGVVQPNAMRQLNWQDEIFNMGVSKNLGASIRGGHDGGNYYFSVGTNDQEGVVDNSRFQTGDFRFNFSEKLSDRMKLDIRLSAFLAKGSFAQDGDRTSGQRSFVANVLNYRPLLNVDEQGIDNDLQLSNPYSWINDFEDVSNEQRYFANLSLTYDLPIDGLSYRLRIGGNSRTKERRRFYGLTTFQGSSTNGSLGVSEMLSQSYQVNNLLQFKKTYKYRHRFNGVLGITYDVRDIENERYEVNNFSTLVFRSEQPQYAQDVRRPVSNTIRKTEMLSFLGRLNYSYKNQYIFTGSLRVDGSSKFVDENRYGFFPSFSFAWNMKRANFLIDNDFVSQLKLRAGWGQIGSQGISAYQTSENYTSLLYGTNSNDTGVAFARSNIANDQLKWETTEQINVGIDFGLFKNGLSGSLDLYTKDTKDLLQNQNLPGSSGFSTYLLNRGSVNNRGIELALSAVLVDKEDFGLEVSGNIAFNRSKITSLGIPEATMVIGGRARQKSYYLGQNISTGTYFRTPANIFIEGEEIGLFYGWQTDGIYQEGDDFLNSNFQAGDIKIIDQLTVDTDNDGIADAGDGVIDNQDKTIIGNPNPDFVYGLTLNMRYKRFTLTALFNGVQGNQLANGNLLRSGTPEGLTGNIIAEVYHQAWRPDKPSNLYPRIGYNKENQATGITDRIIEDGSFFRLNNLTLNYDLPFESMVSQKRKEDSGYTPWINLSGCSVYLSAQNLFTATDYSGYNPEVTNFLYNGNILGVDWNGLPNIRTYTLGLNINF